jgi:hypothetical protein
MITVYIDKNKWSEITIWCLDYFGPDNWAFHDGPCLIEFNNEYDRVLFALKWGV